MLVPTLLLWLCVAGQVEAPAQPPEKAGVERLIGELEAPEKARRDEAEQQLLALGPAVLDLLPEITDQLPAETRLRLGRIRAQLEKARAEQSVQASHVTLPKGAMRLSEVLQAFKQQTGNNVVDYRGRFGQAAGDPRLEVEFDHVPFWEALDRLLDQADLTTYAYPDLTDMPSGIALVSRTEGQRPRLQRGAYAGAFRIEAVEFDAHRDLRDPANQTLQLLVEVAWEPRLLPIVIMQPTEAVQAVDDQGRPIVPADEGNELEIPVNSGASSVELPLHFRLPPRDAQRIASLRGRLSVLVPGKVEAFRFAKLDQLARRDRGQARKLEQKKADVTVVLERVARAQDNPDIWECHVRVLFDQTSGALESHRGWVLNNEAYLERDKERIPCGGLNTTLQTETEVGVVYLFDMPDGLKGCTFVYMAPSAVVSVPIEYELKDLELP